MHSLLQVPVKSAVFGRFCFARAYRYRSETYRQRNINSKHTTYVTQSLRVSSLRVLQGVSERMIFLNHQ